MMIVCVVLFVSQTIYAMDVPDLSQEQLNSYFSERLHQVNVQIAGCTNIQKMFAIWDQEETELNLLSLSSDMRDDRERYKQIIKERKNELSIPIEKRNRDNKNALFTHIVQLAHKGNLDEAAQLTSNVEDQDDQETLILIIENYKNQLISAQEDEDSGPHESDSLSHNVVSDVQEDEVPQQLQHPVAGRTARYDFGFGLAAGGLIFSLSKIYQHFYSFDYCLTYKLEKLIPHFNQHNQEDQLKARYLLHELAHKIWVKVEQAIDDHKSSLLKVQHEIIALTYDDVTRDQLVQIVTMVKSECA